MAVDAIASFQESPMREIAKGASMVSSSAPNPLFMNRRAALQIGAGLLGLHLPGYLRAAQSAAGPMPDLSCIFIFLAGGASQFETFDPKPEAPAEIRGEWNVTSTNVPGTYICEKLPLLAQRMDKVAIIRSWQGKNGSHDIGSQHVASGFLPSRAGQYFPNFGCLISALYGSRVHGMPAILDRRTMPSISREIPAGRNGNSTSWDSRRCDSKTGNRCCTNWKT
jgi:hypothetical protein